MGGVSHIAMLIFFLQGGEFLGCLQKLVLLTEDAHLVPHGVDHGITDFRHSLACGAVTGGDFRELVLPLGAVLGHLLLIAFVLVLLGIGCGAVASGVAEDQHLGEGVGPQAVGAMDGNAAALTCYEDAGHTGCARVEVGHLQAAHGVVAGGSDGHHFLLDIHAGKALGEIPDLTQALVDALGRNVAEVHVDACMDAFADAAALQHFRGNGTGHDIAGGQLFLLRGVLAHEALAVLVDEERTLSAAGLGEQHAVGGKARGVELHHFGILEGDADVHAGHDAVTGGAIRVGGADPVDTAIAAGSDDDSLGSHAQEVAAAHIHGDDAIEFVSVHADFQHLAFGDEVNIVLQALLEEGMHHGMACAVLEVSSPGVGGTAHLALMEGAVLLAVVGIAHEIHLIDVLAGPLGEVFHCILVAEVVAALDGVEHVGVHAVLRVGDAGDAVHAALGHGGSGAGGHQLGHDSHFQVLVLGCCQGCAHASAAAADNQHIVGDFTFLHRFGNVLPIPGEVGTCSQSYARSCRTFYKCAA